MSTFETDTAVTLIEAGRYSVDLSERWWVRRGPNGGYVAALMLRAMDTFSKSANGDGPAQPPRSLTVHFLSTPSVGLAEIEVTLERKGRSTTFLSARLIQDGQVQGKAMAVFSAERQGPSFIHSQMPEVPAPEDGEEFDISQAPVPVFTRFRAVPVIGGAPMSGGDGEKAETAGWLKLRDEQPMDAVLAAAVLDFWYPAPFATISEPAVAPTLEYTVHFPCKLPLAETAEPDWVLARLTAGQAVDGHFSEDGELWSRDGRLLARCRQVALLKSRR
jgi:acyl-CoA thioesterase